MSRRSLQRILHEELQFHPYKIMIVQQLAKGDFAQCREFCEEMFAILTEDANVVVMMSDKAHFHLNGEQTKLPVLVSGESMRGTPSTSPQLKSDSVVWCY
jgi:hypothetical protein